MKIGYHRSFEKSYKKKDFKIRKAFKEKLLIFMRDPLKKELKNHKLSWKYLWLRSINITWDYRAIFKELSSWNYEFVEFTDIGTHSQLYK